MINYKIGKREKLQIINLQKQPKAVYRYDISIARATCLNFKLRPIKVSTVVYYGIDTETSHIQNQPWFSH